MSVCDKKKKMVVRTLALAVGTLHMNDSHEKISQLKDAHTRLDERDDDGDVDGEGDAVGEEGRELLLLLGGGLGGGFWGMDGRMLAFFWGEDFCGWIDGGRVVCCGQGQVVLMCKGKCYADW